ncbi:hypothetical protein D3C72_1016840 [compost metagenome]
MSTPFQKYGVEKVYVFHPTTGVIVAAVYTFVIPVVCNAVIEVMVLDIPAILMFTFNGVGEPNEVILKPRLLILPAVAPAAVSSDARYRYCILLS